MYFRDVVKWPTRSWNCVSLESSSSLSMKVTADLCDYDVLSIYFSMRITMRTGFGLSKKTAAKRIANSLHIALQFNNKKELRHQDRMHDVRTDESAGHRKISFGCCAPFTIFCFMRNVRASPRHPRTRKWDSEQFQAHASELSNFE